MGWLFKVRFYSCLRNSAEFPQLMDLKSLTKSKNSAMENHQVKPHSTGFTTQHKPEENLAPCCCAHHDHSTQGPSAAGSSCAGCKSEAENSIEGALK